MTSYILITENSENYIEDVLYNLLPLNDNEELIIFDNHSTDDTVPKIISMMGVLWIDKGKKYKFYINKKKEEYEVVKNKALSIAKGEPIIIEKKKKIT